VAAKGTFQGNVIMCQANSIVKLPSNFKSFIFVIFCTLP